MYLKLLECYNGSSRSRLPQSKGIIGRVFPISQQGECVESIQHAGDNILLILSCRSQARELNKSLKNKSSYHTHLIGAKFWHANYYVSSKSGQGDPCPPLQIVEVGILSCNQAHLGDTD